MKSLVSILSIVAVLGLAPAALVAAPASSPSPQSLAAPHPALLVSKDGRFKCQLPSGVVIPRPMVQKVNSRGGPLNLSTWYIPTQTRVWMVSYNDYPPALLDPKNQKQELENVRDDLVRKLHASIDTQAFAAVQGCPALTFQVSGRTGAGPIFGRSMVVLKGTRLYQQVLLCQKKSDLDGPDVKEYFKSFQITP